MRFDDNGRGMDRADIQELLTVIGRSGTSEATGELADHDRAVETIGQFGIGLLSAFVVAERIDVYTRKVGTDAVWHWANSGGEDYQLEPAAGAEAEREPGTTLVVAIGALHREHLEPERIKQAVRKYADFLPYPIQVNGEGPVNAMHAPWHRGAAAFAGPDDYQRELARFINERYPDFPLHVIPVELDAPRARGALYISDRHVPGINTTGVVDIYQGRMAIRAQEQELLPEWAKFVRGILDSPDLQPTAARDNVMKDDAYFRLREALGRLIIDSLVALSKQDRPKFLRLCEWHHYHLKGMAVHHDDFHTAVIDHLPFETNKGQLTLPEVCNRQPAAVGKKTPLYYFSYGYDSNQFYELCEAKGLIAVNTGRQFDETLIRRYAEQNAATVELRQLDTLDSPDLYQALDPEEARGFYDLEAAIRRALQQVRIDRVHPQTRRFAPATMSGVLLSTQKLEAQDKMQELLSQPFMLEGLGDWAEEMRDELKRSQLDLYLNADNPLIQGLAGRDDLDEERWQPLLVGVYNNAILYSQHRMSPENAQVFYHQFQNQMLRTLATEADLDRLRTERNALNRQLLEMSPTAAADDRDWPRVFVMMPYDAAYDPLEQALRAILERPPYCFEVLLARDKAIDPQVRGNIQRHIGGADGYIAEISHQSPNVLLELGWIFFEPQLDQRPKLILRHDGSKAPPVDMGGQIHQRYSAPDAADLTEQLRRAIEAQPSLKALRDQRPARWLSAGLLADLTAIAEDARAAVARAFDSVEQLQAADDRAFAEALRRVGRPDLAMVGPIVRSHLEAL